VAVNELGGTLPIMEFRDWVKLETRGISGRQEMREETGESGSSDGKLELPGCNGMTKLELGHEEQGGGLCDSEDLAIRGAGRLRMFEG
jgi:hypothetical protein